MELFEPKYSYKDKKDFCFNVEDNMFKNIMKFFFSKLYYIDNDRDDLVLVLVFFVGVCGLASGVVTASSGLTATAALVRVLLLLLLVVFLLLILAVIVLLLLLLVMVLLVLLLVLVVFILLLLKLCHYPMPHAAST